MEIKKIHFTVKEDVKEQADFSCYRSCTEWYRNTRWDVENYPPCFSALTHKDNWKK